MQNFVNSVILSSPKAHNTSIFHFSAASPDLSVRDITKAIYDSRKIRARVMAISGES